ncbi:hypothetical protein LG299_12700 [Microbacterium lacus]|uniref:hypothetical protein n=1 Tax=Microbacterium lacus TaxID=415217 RepID=UPI00384EFF00
MNETLRLDTDALHLIFTFDAARSDAAPRRSSTRARLRHIFTPKRERLAGVAAVLIAVSLFNTAGGEVQANSDQPEVPAQTAPLAEPLASAPLEVGAEVASEGWHVQLGAVEWGAQDRVAAATYMPTPPPDDWQWALVDISVTNTSDEVASAGLIEVALVSGEIVFADWLMSHHYPAQTIPNPLPREGIPAGGLSAGYVGFMVPNAAIDDCTLRLTIHASPGDAVHQTWLACN